MKRLQQFGFAALIIAIFCFGATQINISQVSGLSSALSGKQASDADLTTIAGLSPTNDDVMQYKAGAWANRTIAQLKTDLNITSVTGNAGTATALQTARAIYGNNFDGTAALAQIIASTYGGTGNGFTKFSGPTTSEKTFTLPNASATILTDNALVTAAQGGTANGFFQVSGPATTTKTFSFPNASATVLTDNAVVTGAQGGTGVNNSGKTITLANNFTTSGNFAMTLTATGTTVVTLPTSGTLATLAGSETFTNKTIAWGSNTITGLPVTIIVAVSDESTAITTGTAKVTFRMPHAMTLTAVRASVNTASSSGLPTINVKESGTTIFSTKVTIDANEKTSQTAATAAVISDVSLADDAEMTIDIDVAGTGAKGLKIAFIGTR